MLTVIDRERALLSTVVARGTSLRKDPLDGVKRRAYLIATLSGLPAVLLVWPSMGSEGFVANAIYSLVVLYFSISALACASPG